jgi:hypothetical protein
MKTHDLPGLNPTKRDSLEAFQRRIRVRAHQHRPTGTDWLGLVSVLLAVVPGVGLDGMLRGPLCRPICLA